MSAGSFDSQPTLKGEHVELRPLCVEDYDALYGVACDPLIWEQHPSRNRHEPVEIGWTFLARSHGGGRYNADMKRLMLTHAFRFVNRVFPWCADRSAVVPSAEWRNPLVDRAVRRGQTLAWLSAWCELQRDLTALWSESMYPSALRPLFNSGSHRLTA